MSVLDTTRAEKLVALCEAIVPGSARVGPVVYIYVGISKTSGKLIALMTEAVYT